MSSGPDKEQNGSLSINTIIEKFSDVQSIDEFNKFYIRNTSRNIDQLLENENEFKFLNQSEKEVVVRKYKEGNINTAYILLLFALLKINSPR